MDIRNYTWVDTFELSTNSSMNTSENPLIIGLGIAGIAILMIIGFFGYKTASKKYFAETREIRAR